jgi:mannose-6-phosphate isomerase-like protein (cupin superfamily)
MSESTPYVINTDIRFGPLQRIDVRELAGACKHRWFNQSLCGVNDCVVRLGVLKGEFHWHKHDLEDEFFYVVEGRLIVEYEDRKVTLGPHQGITVPRGVMHRTSAPERTVVLMVEGSGVKPTGD